MAGVATAASLAPSSPINVGRTRATPPAMPQSEPTAPIEAVPAAVATPKTYKTAAQPSTAAMSFAESVAAPVAGDARRHQSRARVAAPSPM